MTESLWDDTTEALTAEASARAEQYARASVRPFLAYTGAAVTREDLETRIALLEAPVQAAVASITGSGDHLPHALAEIRSEWLKTGTRYCPSHKVYVGEGNQEQHDHCNVETRKKKEAGLADLDDAALEQEYVDTLRRMNLTFDVEMRRSMYDWHKQIEQEQARRKTAGFRDFIEKAEKPSATAQCKWCGKDIGKVGTIWETKEEVGRDICTKNNSTTNPSGGLGNHQPKSGTSKKTSASKVNYSAIQEAVRRGMMIGRSEFINPGAMLPSRVYVVMEPGPNGSRPTDRKTSDMAEAGAWAEELIARTDWSPWDRTSTKTSASENWYPGVTREPGTVITTNGGEVKGLLSSNGHTYSVFVEDPETNHGFWIDSSRIKKVYLDDTSKQAQAKISSRTETLLRISSALIREAEAADSVNDSAEGSERYQKQPTLPPHLQDGYVDQDQGKVDKQVEQGKIEHTPTASRRQASDNSRVPGEKMPYEYERDSGEDVGPNQPRTTRPRVSPTPSTNKTYVAPRGGESDVDFSSPTFDQQVAAKVAKIARRVVEDNPHISREHARALALRAMTVHPGVVSTKGIR